MIRKRAAGIRTQAVRANRRTPGTRALVLGLALVVAVSCGSGGWRCEVTIVMNGQTVVGTGTGNARDVAYSTARSAACAKLDLDDRDTRRCEEGAQPAAADTWEVSEDCVET